MKREFMEQSTESEIEELAKMQGIELAPCETLKEKMSLIERKRERKAIITIFGEDFEVPMKRLGDKRVEDIMNNPHQSGDDADKVFRLLLGDKQTKRLVDICTEDDGTVDAYAMGLAFIRLMYSEQLKNY